MCWIIMRKDQKKNKCVETSWERARNKLNWLEIDWNSIGIVIKHEKENPEPVKWHEKGYKINEHENWVDFVCLIQINYLNDIERQEKNNLAGQMCSKPVKKKIWSILIDFVHKLYEK